MRAWNAGKLVDIVSVKLDSYLVSRCLIVLVFMLPALAFAGKTQMQVDRMAPNSTLMSIAGDIFGCCDSDVQIREQPACLACCVIPTGFPAVSAAQGFAIEFSPPFWTAVAQRASVSSFRSQTAEFGRPRPSILFCTFRT